jgi:predicted RND superfamily exporter protein
VIERVDRIMGRILARRRVILAAGLALAVAATPFAVLLYANLRSAVEELLPRSAPSVAALDELHRRLGDNMQLGLYLSGPAATDLHRFADRLAERLNALPKPPRFIDYRPQELQAFFLPRRLLFVDHADLVELDRRVAAHIDHGRRTTGPFDLGLEDDAPAPPPLAEVTDKYRAIGETLTVYPSGYYDGDDGHSLAMVMYPSDGVIGYERSLEFRDTVVREAEATKAELGLPSLSIQLTGDVMASILEQRSLEADLLVSSLIVLVMEALLLLGFFRWRPSVLVLTLPLSIGTLVTLAISYGFLRSLNASTAFLGSIIVGNGVNPGIILLARYIEERRRGASPDAAARTSTRTTLLATLVASSAAALSYGALVLTDFRGYSQFGFMGLLGMTLCWIATYVWLPPAAVALDRRWPIAPAATTTLPTVSRLDRAFAAVGRLGVKHPRPVLAVGAAVTALAVVAVAPLITDPYDYDTTRMRSSWASEPGGYVEVAKYMDAILKRQTTPIVILTHDAAEVEPIAKQFRDLLAKGNPDLVLGGVMTLQSLVPPDQQAKLAVIERTRARLTPAVLNAMDAPTRKLVADWMPPPGLASYGIDDLPESVRRQFREKDGQLGRLVLLFAKVGSRTTDGHVVQQFAAEARSVPLPRGTPVAGSFLIFADMFAAIGRDGPIATVVALLAVIILSLLLARGARGGVTVTASLVVGVLWTVGIAAVSGMRLNFLNFIALPITFGIGVDYAANVYGRYRLTPGSADDILRAVSSSGAAVAACSATTVIGYSSLLFSRNGALFSFGLLAVLGELACLAAALLVMPALLSVQLETRPVLGEPEANELERVSRLGGP